MPPNILIIRLSSLGDIVLTAPVYRSLKAHWPDCRVSVLVKPQYVPVLQGHPCVDEVIVFRSLWDALTLIRNRRFTHLLDLHCNLRSFFIRRLSTAPHKARYRKDVLARRLFVAMGWAGPRLTKHTIERYLLALRQWGVPSLRPDLTLGDWNARPMSFQTPVKRILLLQTAFLGDATLTFPLAREIKRLLPSSQLTVLARPDTSEVFRSSPWVDDIIQDDKRGASGGIRGFWELSKTLESRKFDLAIVPHRSLRSALLALLSKIPRRIGFSSSAGGFLFTDPVPFAWGMHDLERNLGLLLPLQPSPLSERDTVYLRPAANPEIDNLLEPIPSGSRSPTDSHSYPGMEPAVKSSNSYLSKQRLFIGFHPGSVWATKRWPEERFAELIRRLTQEFGAEAMLVGGKQDLALSERVAHAAGVPVLNLTGKTSLRQLIALMSRLSLFVTNDSGPMHIATASGVPTLAFFGPTTRELGFFPYGSSHKVLEVELACRPCGLHGSKACPEGHFLCMRLISVDWAYRTALELLAARASTQSPNDSRIGPFSFAQAEKRQGTGKPRGGQSRETAESPASKERS